MTFNRKEYMKAYNKTYRERNKKSLLKKRAERYSKNKDHVKDYNREYLKNNHDTISIKKKEYANKHKNEIREYMKQYRIDNKDILSERYKDYYDTHKSEISQKHRERNKIKGYVSIHNKTAALIRKLNIRPNECTICHTPGIIEAHHPDYSKRNEVVFVCQPCHHSIHNGLLSCPTPINILSYK